MLTRPDGLQHFLPGPLCNLLEDSPCVALVIDDAIANGEWQTTVVFVKTSQRPSLAVTKDQLAGSCTRRGDTSEN